jgi:hypothetical protein
MIANFLTIKNPRTLVLLSMALILFLTVLFAPFKFTIADEREFRVFDENGTPVRGALARQVCYQYSLRFQKEENHKTDSDGYIRFPKRVVDTSLFDLLSGEVSKIIDLKIDAGISSSDSIGVHADGYEWRWFDDGEGLEKKLVVLKRQ